MKLYSKKVNTTVFNFLKNPSVNNILKLKKIVWGFNEKWPSASCTLRVAGARLRRRPSWEVVGRAAGWGGGCVRGSIKLVLDTESWRAPRAMRVECAAGSWKQWL